MFPAPARSTGARGLGRAGAARQRLTLAQVGRTNNTIPVIVSRPEVGQVEPNLINRVMNPDRLALVQAFDRAQEVLGGTVREPRAVSCLTRTSQDGVVLIFSRS